MNLKQIPAGKKIPNDIYVIIEIPAYSQSIKYEVNKEIGVVFVDRIMYNSMFYPCNYGYINQTLSSDNDPIDVLIPTPHPLQIGSVIRCRPIGMLKMTDELGTDNKIIAVPHHSLSQEYENIMDINDLPYLLKEQITHFFKYYKKLDNKKWTKIEGWENSDTAKREISSSFYKALSKKK